MKQRSLLIVVTVVLTATFLTSWRPLPAAEPVVEFVEGLRRRGYYDTAQEYLDRIENDPQIPGEIRQRIAYERAVVLNEKALNLQNAELKHRLLDRAAAELDRFIKDMKQNNPNHPLLGDAQTRQGKIFLGKARVNILEAGSADAGRRKQLQQKALEFIDQAEAIFKDAREEHRKHWKSFPVYIPPEEREKRRARRKAEVEYMKSQIDLAKTTYDRAQVYKADYERQQKRKQKPSDDSGPAVIPDHPYYKLLDKAAEQFEEIHTKYRSQVAGLYARMWQGKCFEEQDEIGRALGIYNELLGHEGDSPTLKNLQRQVLSFKLISLNHEKRKDYHLVEQAATEWLQNNRRYERTIPGLRIRFERARAREALGMGADPNLSEDERNRYLRNARQDAEYVKQFPGKFNDVSTLMLSRLKRALGIETEDPTIFSDAYSAAQIAYAKFQTIDEQLQEARKENKPQKDIDALTGKLSDQMERTAHLFRLCLKLAQPDDNPEHISRARYILSFVYYLQNRRFNRPDRIYDAAVLAEFVSRHDKQTAPDTARDAAYVAMASYITLYNEAPAGERETEMQWIIRIARHIVDTWPGSNRAIDAAEKLGDMYNQQERYLLAAYWYSQIPETADKYALSLLNAGTNYWGHYSVAAGLIENTDTYREALRNSVGERWPLAVADQLNPSWNQWQRLKRLDDIDSLLAGDKPAAAPGTTKQNKARQPAANNNQPKAGSGSKKNSNKKKKNKKANTKRNKAGTTDNKKKSGQQQDGGRSPKTRNKSGTNASPRKQQIAQLKQQSVQELQSALARLTGKPADEFQNRSEDDLRRQLLTHLNTLTPAKLQDRFHQHLQGLSDDELKARFQHNLNQWRTLAAWYLARGIREMESQLTETSSTPEDLTRAKVAFAEYAIGAEMFDEAIRLLGEVDRDTHRPHTVLAAIQVDDDANRPQDRSVKSRDFASAVFQTLAIAYIGADQLDKFRTTLNKLKDIVAGDDAADLTDLYKKLGRQLQKEIERLKNQGDAQALKAKRDIFRRAFDTLLQGEDQLDFNLLMWIGEASYALGAGVGDPSQSTGYFEQAAKAYDLALDKGQNLNEDQRLAVQLRLLNCRRRQKKLQDALQLAREVISKRPNLLPAQVEAALTLQDIGLNDDPDRLLDARRGITFDDTSPSAEIWGWEELGDRLFDQAADYNQTGSKTELAEYNDYFERYLTARYNLTWCLYQYGKAQTDPPQRRKALSNARRELAGFGRSRGDIDKRNWKLQDPQTDRRVDAKPHFEQLYADIQQQLGTPEVDLQPLKWGFRELVGDREQVARNAAGQPLPTDDSTEPQKADDDEQQSGGSGLLGMVFGVLLLLGGLGLGGWFIYRLMGQGKRRRPIYAYTTGGGGPGRSSRAASSKTTPSTKSGKSTQGRTTRSASGKQSTRKKAPPTTSGTKGPSSTSGKKGSSAKPPSSKQRRSRGGPSQQSE